MILLHAKRVLPFVVVGFFCFNLASNLFAQVPNYTAPIPLNMGDFGRVDPNVNNLLFFQHGIVPTSSQNFRDSPSPIRFNNEETYSYDVIGAPGSPPADPSQALLEMLATPAGLCLENFLPNITCNNNIPEARSGLRQSWSQLIADLRNTITNLPNTSEVERNIPNVALPNVTLSGNPSQTPYADSPLGSIVDSQSPPAVCYDITAEEDWIACPVFGLIGIGFRGSKTQTSLELQSPILLYRKNETGIYKLAGYLGNPSMEDQYVLGGFRQKDQFRIGNVYFPVAIASGNFSETPEAPGASDIAVMSTATLPHILCKIFISQFTLAGRGSFPHGLNCSFGYTWVRTRRIGEWTTPRDTFGSKDFLVGGPKTYDLAGGLDKTKTVLFAPSNAPDSQNHFYVYKYYEEGLPAITHGGMPAIPQLIPPKPIRVTPPKAGYGPFKIATMDINGDGYADFALTWKSTSDVRVDSNHNLWKGSYSPYVSIYVSTAPSAGGTDVKYSLKDNYKVPKIDANVVDDEAELAGVSFMQKENGKKYLVVGNQKRISVSGDYHAFDYIFSISSDGVVDSSLVQIKPVQVSFRGEDASAPGVADISTDPFGNIASSIRIPFIPAPEGCDVGNGEVYGALWFGKIISKFPSLLDREGSGIPNRCKCFSSQHVIGDETNDANLDDYPDTCPALSGSSLPIIVGQNPPEPPKEETKKETKKSGNFVILNPDKLMGQVEILIEEFVPPSSQPPFQQQQVPPPPKVLPTGPCGFIANVFPGLSSSSHPCDEMGDKPREVTAILARAVVPVKACDPTKDEACKPFLPHQDISLNQFCIAKVGRDDPKTSAVFEADQKQIKEANDRVQSITGIKDFDIFVGGEAGAVHWECALIGGAFASPSKVAGALPNVSGNVAPFAVWQTIGVPPLKFTNRPMPELEIKNPLRLTPVEVSDSGASGEINNLNVILPSVSGEEFMTGDGVQVGNLNYNINGKIMIKVLQAGDDFTAEGTSLSVNQLQSLFALDFVAYPALLTKSVQDSQLSFDVVFKELEKRVEEYKMAGKPITIDIYRNLPWEKAMSPEFLIAQAKLPDAVTAANLALQPPDSRATSLGGSGASYSASSGPITNDPNQIVLPAYILPPGVYASGGGCGCRFNVRMQPDIILFQLLLLLVPLAGVISYRHSLSKKK